MQSYKPNNNHPLSRQSQRWVGVSNRISKYSVFTLILLTSVNLFAEGVLKNTPTPAEIPFTTPQVMSHYVTDTGKILPRKYTHLTAKHQRAITKTIKHSRNMLLAQ